MENVQVATPELAETTSEQSKSLWRHAIETLMRDKIAVSAFVIVVVYALMALFTTFGWIAADWAQEVGASYSAPSSEHWFGTDIFGRSVVSKTIKGTQIAMSIGFFTAIISAVIGIFFRESCRVLWRQSR